MHQLLKLVVQVFLLVFLLGSAVAAEGPANGKEAFRPTLGFNPSCGIKGISEAFPKLGVYRYDDKVYGYVRYCAIQEGDRIRIKLISEWTNGMGVGTSQLCSSHSWYAADGSAVVSVNRRLEELPHRGDIILSDSTLLTQEQFESVREWAWDFWYCANRSSAVPAATATAVPVVNFVVVLRVLCADAQGGTGSVDSTVTSPDSCGAAFVGAQSLIKAVPDFCQSQLSGSYMETDDPIQKVSTNTCP
jgi:hypothetical protein